MQFRILGPLEIVGEHGPVTLHRGKEQALLAYLLLHANRVVPSERLIDELWDGRPPPTAPKILQNAVSQLRRALGDGRVETRAPGYLFKLADDELDADRFEQLARSGRSEEALALWRGTPLVELREERFADEARRRLEDQRVAVLEDRIESDLEAGRHADLVPELEHLVANHPLRERLQAQLMRALYASGRQGDALEAYRRARQRLSEELGLEPGPELQALQRKILEHDPDLAARTPPTARMSARRLRPRRMVVAAGIALALAAATVGVVAATRGGAETLVATANSIASVDTGSNRVLTVTPVDPQPRGIATDGSVVWVANPSNGTVQRLNAGTGHLEQTVGIGSEAIDLVIGDGDVWVAGGNDDTLTRLDARNGGIKERTDLPRERDPTAPAWSVAFANDFVWVTSGSLVLKRDPATETFVLRNQCCHRPYDMAIGNGLVWVADFGTHVGIVSERTGRTLETIDVDLYTDSIAVGLDSVWLTVTDSYGSNATLLRIDPALHRVIQAIPIGPATEIHSYGLPIALGDGSIWIANPERGDVLRIDPRSGKLANTVHVGGKPWALAYAAGRLWLTVD